MHRTTAFTLHKRRTKGKRSVVQAKHASMNIVVACGGTGGHVIPGVVMAQRLRRRGHVVSLWIAGKAVENVSLADWDGGPVVRVPAEGFQGGVSASVRAVAQLIQAMRLSRSILQRERPGCLLALGGYACVGPVCAARSLGIPIVLHEANAVPGRAVSLLAPWARTVAISVEETRRFFPRRTVVLTGYPVRENLSTVPLVPPLQPGLFTVLTLGGSQGARRLNEVVPAALAQMTDGGRRVQAVHLTGAHDETAVRERYGRMGIPFFVCRFLAEMGRAYASADVAVTRAGAGTCAELAFFRVPAVLVPLPTATRNHQLANARMMECAGGAHVLEQRCLTPESLAAALCALADDPLRLSAMREALTALPVAGAAERLADLIERVV